MILRSTTSKKFLAVNRDSLKKFVAISTAAVPEIARSKPNQTKRFSSFSLLLRAGWRNFTIVDLLSGLQI
jgi:hypothetical protein